MKPFGGGQLLNTKTSPFKEALTKIQCIQYALDRPGVLTVLPGVRNRKDLADVLKYLEASEKERDYSVMGQFAPQNAEEIWLINKYYDLALAGDEMARGHYEKLAVKAEDCVKCGHCEARCPFHVKQEDRMEEIRRYFESL